MTTTRTFARSAAVIGAATALTLAGAGAAMAATSHEVNDTLLSVTFTKDSWLDSSLCFAAVVPTAGAAGVVEQFQGAASGNIQDIFDLISGNSAVTPLTTDSSGNGNGFSVVTVIAGNNSVYADLDPNVYTLISKCTGDDPVINPAVVVGNPVEAVMGSVQMGSSEDGLGAMSSILSSGMGGGTGGVLSSALGGGSGE